MTPRRERTSRPKGSRSAHHRTLRRPTAGLVVIIGLLAALPAVAVADPPRPGTTDSGLNESEAATLWSKDPDEAYVTNEAYRDAYGENRTVIHEIANGTDLTFTRPPATASRWTRYAHGTYEPGGRNTSVHPPHATTKDGAFIKDAHATTFALSPATVAHVAPNDTRFYVRPDGRLLGTVDYRVELPPTNRSGDGTVRWRLLDDEIDEVRLYVDDEHRATEAGTPRPNITYDLPSGASTVSVEADIEITVEKTVIDERDSQDPQRTTTRINRSLTVRDATAVDVYDVRATTHRVTYPDGTTGILVLQHEPWRGYSLTENGSMSVGGIWRFYTARETAWDSLVHATREGEDPVDSAVLPVYVHAYPSRLGPRTKPEYGGPTLVRTWGSIHDAPASTIHENVSVEVVEAPYESTRGIAVEAPPSEAGNLTVNGIVYGAETPATTITSGTTRVRPVTLSAEIIDRNRSAATVLVTLRESDTGAPIHLANATGSAPGDTAGADAGDDERNGGVEPGGYIELDGRRIRTNETGQATVVLSQPGSFTARYVPRTWVETSTPYAGATAVVRWHPLSTVGGWLQFVAGAALAVAPFVVAWYAGRRLGAVVSLGGSGGRRF